MKNLIKTSYIVIVIFFLTGCSSSSSFKKDFINIEKSVLLKIGMTQNEVKSILGDPHYMESILKEENIKEYRLFYNIRDKVYKFDTQTNSDGVIIGGKKITQTDELGDFFTLEYEEYEQNNSWGFSSHSRSLVLYFIDEVLIRVEVENN